MTNAAEEKMSVMIPPFGRLRMRHSEKFHPEWGYLAPAPSFIRTARVVLAATVRRRNRRCRRDFLVSRPSFIRDLGSSAHVDRGTSGGHTIYPAEEVGATLVGVRSVDGRSGKQRENQLDSAGAGRASFGSVCLLPGNPPEKTTVVPLVEATETPAPSTEQVKKKAMNKPNVTSHYAWRGADSGRWGGAYYSDRGWRCRDTW